MATLPRVSMVLLAYNQEAYVREAVEAALAQDYPNLEIVLSDDCSTDRTFEYMSDLVERYRGPHTVVLNRTAANRGVLAHLYEVVGLTTGGFIVCSAGDDLSYPTRVSRVADTWVKSGADAIISRYDLIDENGATLVANVDPAVGEYDVAAYFPGGGARQITGMSSSYSRRVFEAVKLPEQPIMAEDYFFSLMLGLRSRRTAAIDEPLVRYRVHAGALTSADERSVGLEEYERRSGRSSEIVAAILHRFERAVLTGEGISEDWGQSAQVDLARVRRDRSFYEFRARWLEAGFLARLSALVRYRSAMQRRWLLPRIFGIGGLRLLKRLRARHTQNGRRQHGP
jgi:glycosyltransferase involved in cell wall biosynthesis